MKESEPSPALDGETVEMVGGRTLAEWDQRQALLTDPQVRMRELRKLIEAVRREERERPRWVTVDGEEDCEQFAYVVGNVVAFRLEHCVRADESEGWWEVYRRNADASEEVMVTVRSTEAEARTWVEKQAGKGE